MISDITIDSNTHIRQCQENQTRLASRGYNHILLRLLPIIMMHLLDVYYPLVNRQLLNKNRSKIMKHFFCSCQRASG